MVDAAFFFEEDEMANREFSQARKAAGFSQDELSEKSGIHQSRISRIESGKAEPTVADLMAWAKACAAPPESLLPGFAKKPADGIIREDPALAQSFETLLLAALEELGLARGKAEFLLRSLREVPGQSQSQPSVPLDENAARVYARSLVAVLAPRRR